MRCRRAAGGGSCAAALVAAWLWSGSAVAAALEFSDGEGAVLFACELQPHDRWCLRWNHSVAGFTVQDCFVFRPPKMVLDESLQPDFAAGLGQEGLFGLPLGVAATFIFVFVLFGAFLEVTGAGKFFIDLAYAATGRQRGGPAKAAVIASAGMGSISGSAIANVVTTGAFTIPLMKRLGYRPAQAGGIEAAASTGGQIMPPLMGAGAFLIAEHTGVPYLEIVKISIIPALLYCGTVYLFVHIIALKQGMQGMPASELPSVRQVMRDGWHFLVPLVVLVYLLVMHMSPMRVGFYAVVSVVAVAVLRYLAWFFVFGPRQGHAVDWARIRHMLATGLRLLVGPALTNEFGIPLLIAHLVVFWYSQDSNVTPPVALAGFAGAAIAGARPMETSVQAWKFAKGLYLIPVFMVFNPELILGGPLAVVVWNVVIAIVALAAFAAALEGWLFMRMGVVSRLLIVPATIAIFYPDIVVESVGLATLVIVLAANWWASRRAAPGVPVR